MSDQAETLRKLMAGASKDATELPSLAPFEPPAVVDFETIPTVESETPKEDRLDFHDFHVADDLPIVDELLLASRFTQMLDQVDVAEADLEETVAEEFDDGFENLADDLEPVVNHIEPDESTEPPVVVDAEEERPPLPRPRIALLVGGRRGTGTTTLAGQLATAMSELGETVDVCELDTLPPHVIDGNPGLELHDAADDRDDQSDNWIVVDGGFEFDRRLEQIWAIADSVTVITTTDPASVTGSYRLLKSADARGLSLQSVGLLVNQALDEHDAQRIGARIRRCCERFLDHSQREAQWVAFDARTCGATTAVNDLRASDTKTHYVLDDINRNVKNWADRVWSLPRSERKMELEG